MAKKKCATKNCENEFIQYNSLTKYCIPCAIKLAKPKVQKDIVKKEKERKKELKEKLKTVSDYRKDARYWFQRYIRIRDLGKTCISCPTLLTDIREYDAGHYFNAKSYPTLLFDEFNVSGQCKFCNDHLSGNLIAYRKGLINRYGVDVLIDLDMKSEDKKTRTLTKEYYIEIANKYKEIVKTLKQVK